MERRRRTRKIVEVAVVRFRGQKLPSGLYRHRPAKFVFDLSKKRRKDD